MYIFEKLCNWIFPEKLEEEYNYDPLKSYDENDEENCEHVLRPVDSTGRVLACIKCGYVVTLNDNQIQDN